MNIFELVKNKISARDAAEHYGLKVNQKGMACCPFHSDQHPSMKIDQTYYCFGCGEKGDAINYVAKMFGLSQFDAAKKIIEDFHLPIEVGKKKVTKKKSVDLMKKKNDLKTAQVDEIKNRFRKWCTDKCRQCLNAQRLIRTVKDYMIDKDPEVVMNDTSFAVMLQAEPKLNYWLDILCFGTEEEKKTFFLMNRKEVMELEASLFRAGKEILDRDWSCVEQRMCG